MKVVTFQVIEGVDKGRVFPDLSIPVTIGREEGNMLRLNDERVSRYHAKIQQEDQDVILTDLDSTNGTRVNGQAIQIRRLRPGDLIEVGRSRLIYGSLEEIATRREKMSQILKEEEERDATLAGSQDDNLDFELEQNDGSGEHATGHWGRKDGDRPPLPLKMSPSQAARLAEMLDYLHRGVTEAMENIVVPEGNSEVRISFNEWQILQTVQLFLAKYVREIGEPEPFEG